MMDLWEAFTNEVILTGFSITETASLTGNPQRAKKEANQSVG